MAVIGFNITKLNAEVVKVPKGKYTISPNLTLKSVSVEDFPVSKTGDKKVIRSEFSCGFTFEGESTVSVEGNMLFLAPADVADEAGKEYAAKKTLPEGIVQRIMGTIFSRCQTVCIVLAKEVGLPSPVPLPKLTIKSDEKKAE